MLNNFLLDFSPGVRFKYKPDSHIIIWIIEKLTKTNFIEFIENEIIKTFEIKDYNFSYEGPQMYLSSRDILKFGILYLNNGFWNGKEIIKKEFVQQAINLKISGDFPENNDYGYLWWLTNINSHSAFYAGGFGGQYLYIIPEMEMVFVITGNLDKPRLEHKSNIRKYFEGKKIINWR